jgi:glycosyltransferase involved in cell wall biosynthesis
MADPTFTVVMPAYNAAATIGSAISSLLGQTYESFELIVVDDGSTDDTADKVHPFEADGRVWMLRQRNSGLAASRNEAISRARGRLISMLDSDDLWLPTYLESMKTALDDDPGASFAYTDAWIIEDATKRVHKATAMAHQEPPAAAPAEPELLLRELLRRNFVFTSATVRRSALDEVGPFDLRLRAAEDYELWLRLASRGHRAVRSQGTQAVYRIRANSLSRNELLMTKSLCRVFKVVDEEYELSPENRAVAQRRLRELDALLSSDGSALAARYRIKAWLIRRKLAVLGERLYYPTPPPELTRVFPDLSSI